jgi:D-alanine-D-alanine ligase
LEKKLTVCILFGGQSNEHEVSRCSAVSIIKNIDINKYNIIIIGITKNGEWRMYEGDVDKIASGEWEEGNTSKAIIVPDATIKGIIKIDKNDKVTIAKIDIVIPVLHGLHGEDGTIQGLLELAKIPYVGCDVLSSALCMDKVYTNAIFKMENIPHAEYVVLNSKTYEKRINEIKNVVKEKLGYPCFIKPSRAGSSVGITKAHNDIELVKGLKIAAEVDSKILIEEFIDGRELECAVLGNENPLASVVGEILPGKEFYDYDAKYNNENSKTIIPADISKDISNEIKRYALEAFIKLGCRGLSRIDFFVHKKTNKIYINEVNTMPGFTNISMYPKLFEATKISYSNLIDRLIKLAIDGR